MAVRDIPGFEDLKTVVRSADQCTATRVNATFNDGTKRYSLAAASNETTQGVFDVVSGECTEFEKSNVQFRELVTRSLEVFTSRVSQTFEASEPLLTVGTRDLHNFAELVQSADVLEQFHSFVPSPDRHTKDANELTLDWHTDSGLLLVFTPAQMEDGSAGGLMIRKRGVVQEVKFDPRVDLVFMLGDGVRRLVNPKLSTPLDATVHALKVKHTRHECTCSFSCSHEDLSQTPTSRRWWYGRMVLPPAEALHSSGLTFGAIRQQVISRSFREVMALGCSSELLRPLAVGARALLQNCAANQSLCWAVCVDIPAKV